MHGFTAPFNWRHSAPVFCMWKKLTDASLVAAIHAPVKLRARVRFGVSLRIVEHLKKWFT